MTEDEWADLARHLVEAVKDDAPSANIRTYNTRAPVRLRLEHSDEPGEDQTNNGHEA